MPKHILHSAILPHMGTLHSETAEKTHYRYLLHDLLVCSERCEHFAARPTSAWNSSDKICVNTVNQTSNTGHMNCTQNMFTSLKRAWGVS